jgi:hypothetical protein
MSGVWVQLYIGEEPSGDAFKIKPVPEEDGDAFEITKSLRNVNALKEAVKEKSPNKLAGVDAADLKV